MLVDTDAVSVDISPQIIELNICSCFLMDNTISLIEKVRDRGTVTTE
jgi:hypothetical protein